MNLVLKLHKNKTLVCSF